VIGVIDSDDAGRFLSVTGCYGRAAFLFRNLQRYIFLLNACFDPMADQNEGLCVVSTKLAQSIRPDYGSRRYLSQTLLDGSFESRLIRFVRRRGRDDLPRIRLLGNRWNSSA
jgi:hypothetical protein